MAQSRAPVLNIIYGLGLKHLVSPCGVTYTPSILGKPQYKKKRKSSDNVTRKGGGVPPVTSFLG